MKNIIIILIISFLFTCSSNNTKYIDIQTRKVFNILYQKNEFKINRPQLKYFFQNQNAFKKQMLKYINMDWNSVKYLPKDDFFYLVGITQDSTYFDDLYTLVIRNPNINEACTYSCGIVFSLIMTATDKKIEFFKKNINTRVIYNDVITGYSIYKNYQQVKAKLKVQDSLLNKSLIFAEEEKQEIFKKIQKLSTDDVLIIASDNKRSFIDRFMAIKTIEYRANSEKLIPDILYVLFNRPSDATGEFKNSCQNIILNIYSKKNYD